MIHVVVLAKLVPDIRHIPEEAWDLRRGTLRRNRLNLIPNPFDDRALNLAVLVRDHWGGRITVLSMGPPEAKEMCSRGLAFGADEAVLISDKKCAGSDTLATSVVLSRAIERLREDGTPTLVIAGMQSPDGDTAQVPIQVAAMLSWPVLPYVTKAHVEDGGVTMQSLRSKGAQEFILRKGDLPAVVTCTDQLPGLPFYSGIDMVCAAARSGVRVMTARELELEENRIGLNGSATRVVTISVADAVRRESAYFEWTANNELAVKSVTQAMHDAVFGTAGSSATPQEPAELDRPPPGQESGLKAGGETGQSIWALIEAPPDTERLSILAHAAKIALASNGMVTAVLVGRNNPIDADIRTALARAGADAVLVINGPPDASPVETARLLRLGVRHSEPDVLLLSASPEGRVTAPYLAALLGAGLTADCTGFDVKEYTSRKDGQRYTYHNTLLQKRPALGGNIQATIVSPWNIERGLPQMATVRSGPTVSRDVSPEIEVVGWDPPAIDDHPVPSINTTMISDETGSTILRRRDGDIPARNRIDIERCTVLVSVGRGAGGAEGIRDFAEPLAKAVRDRFDINAEVSASRMVVDSGHAVRDQQVGQTGKVVKPDVYIALGISGAAQHRAGMEESDVIISVNSDPEAPIRYISDVFIHGRVEDVVPVLIAAL